MNDQVLTGGLFLAVVALTLFITIRASRSTSGAADFYAGKVPFTPPDDAG